MRIPGSFAAVAAAALCLLSAVRSHAQTATGPEFTINQITEGPQIFSEVAVTRQGNGIFCWNTVVEDRGAIGGRSINLTGQLGEEFAISTEETSTAGSFDCSIAATRFEVFRVAWTHDDLLPQPPRTVDLTTRGEPIHSVSLLTDESRAFYPRIAADHQGRFAAVWSQILPAGGPGQPSDLQLIARRYDPDATPLSEPTAVAAGESCNLCDAFATDIASGWDGSFVVVWMDTQGGDGSGDGVLGRRFDASGQPLGEPFVVSESTYGSQVYPSVASDRAGNFFVVWTATGTDSADTFARLFWADGTPRTGEFIVNTYRPSPQLYPDVAVDAYGDWIAVWESIEDAQGAGREIYGRAFRSDGTPFGPDFHVNPAPEDDFLDDVEVRVALSESGIALVTWTTAHVFGDLDVRGARFVLPCVPDGQTLCLGPGGRFRVRALWRTPQGDAGVGQARSLTSDTGAFSFFGEDNLEVFAKVLDGCGVNARHWVYAAGLTDVEVTLLVTDTTNGDVWSYDNALLERFPPVQDVDALAGCASGVSNATPKPTSEGRARDVEAPSQVRSEETGACVPGEGTLCLLGGRFEVTASFATAIGISGDARAVDLGDESGAFWFFAADNLELVVKVLDACDAFDRFWVYAGGLTDVAVTLDVRDTATGETRQYSNPLGHPFEPIHDASAFATCSEGAWAARSHDRLEEISTAR